MLLKDIRMYFDEWVKWYSFEQTEADFVRRRLELTELIGETEKYLSAAAEKYHKKL